MNTKLSLTTTLILLTAAVLLSACGQRPISKDSANGASTDSEVNKTVTSAPAAPPAGGEPQTAVAGAKRLLASQKAYRIRSTAVSSIGGQPITSTIEVVPPDRMHNIDDNKEVITIGKTMYVKKAGKWQNLGTQMSDMQEKMKESVRKMSDEERAEATKGITGSYKSLGDEMLDGVPRRIRTTLPGGREGGRRCINFSSYKVLDR